MNPVQWGLLSTANIGRLMAEASKPSQAARFVAVANRDGERARQFAADLGLEMAFASYEDLLASDRVDAVYVALPNSMHAEGVIKALTAGKHVLCEKPAGPAARGRRRDRHPEARPGGAEPDRSHR